jgi:hypothetical protein
VIGRVTYCDPERRFGFITPDDGSEQVFFGFPPGMEHKAWFTQWGKRPLDLLGQDVIYAAMMDGGRLRAIWVAPLVVRREHAVRIEPAVSTCYAGES